MRDKNRTAAKISIHEVCGTARLTGTNGIQLHKLILSHWELSKTVVVDFTGVLPSVTFLEQAIGELIGQFTKAEIISKLKLSGLSAADRTILNGIVVKRYHSVNKLSAKELPSQ